jgi:hypothetical protein
MTTMTSKERVQKLFNREPVDVMPCFSGMGMVTVQAIDGPKYGPRSYHNCTNIRL